MKRSAFFFVFLVTYLWIGFPVSTCAKPLQLSKKQVQTFERATEIGHQYGVGDLLPALMYKESTLGVNLVSSNGKHFGPGQVDLTTAQIEARRHRLGKVTPHDLVTTDMGYKISAIYLRYCKHQFRTDERALVCYNGGPLLAQQVKSTEYSRKVMEYAHQLAQWSANNDLRVPNFRTVEQLSTPVMQKRLQTHIADWSLRLTHHMSKSVYTYGQLAAI